MANLSATISLNRSSVQIESPITATVSVTNAGVAAINVTTIQPLAYFTGDAITEDASSRAIGPCITITANQSVPASGSTTFSFPVTFHAPSTKVDDSGSGTYSVTCTIYSDEPDVFAPASPATVTVHPVLPLF